MFMIGLSTHIDFAAYINVFIINTKYQRLVALILLSKTITTRFIS